MGLTLELRESMLIKIVALRRLLKRPLCFIMHNIPNLFHQSLAGVAKEIMGTDKGSMGMPVVAVAGGVDEAKVVDEVKAVDEATLRSTGTKGLTVSVTFDHTDFSCAPLNFLFLF